VIVEKCLSAKEKTKLKAIEILGLFVFLENAEPVVVLIPSFLLSFLLFLFFTTAPLLLYSLSILLVLTL
jgi:hypothetical protein